MGQDYGVVMLGAYVGYDKFVKRKLEEHVLSLEPVMESLIKVKDVQSRFLLLRNCFCPKVNHLLRTTRPELTGDFIRTFESYKKQIFATCLNLNPDTISDIHWNQCGLAISGGMGLGNLNDVQHSAYAASLIACYHTSMKEQFGLEYQLHNGCFYRRF
jgi:hypothetical protein